MNFNQFNQQLQGGIFANKIFLKKNSPKPKKEFTRRINKTLKRVVKTNLLNILNEAIAKPVTNKFLKHKEIIDLRKKKIKEEFHGRTSTPKKKKNEDKENLSPNSSTKVKFIEFSSPNGSSNQRHTLRQQLIDFAQKHNPKPEMFVDLLNIMKSNGLEISRNHDNFFDKKFEVIKMNFGSYLKIGVERAIRSYYRPSYIRKPLALVTSSDELPNNFKEQLELLSIDIAVYIVKSKVCNSSTVVPQCMIIFGRINCEVFNDPFIIGVYYGQFPAPTIGNEIMQPFVDEMKLLEHRELVVEGNYAFKVKINAFLCDPISNSLITCTSLPNSIFGCSKCNQRANLQIDDGFASFPCTMTLATPRSDDDFKYMINNEHHVAQPILAELEIGLISQFALDYKLIVCTGVMKHLMKLWMHGKLDYRINKETQHKISRDLILMTANCPRELTKKPRSLDEIDKWDSSDWNEFLLYFSPIALKSRMPQRYYVHYLYLHLAMRILMSSEKINSEANSFILGQLLNTFIADFTTLYGSDKIDYNVHNLLHFEQVQQKLGPLKNLQGFVYESQILMFNNLLDANEDVNLEEIGEKIYDNTTNILENKVNELINTNYPFLNAKGELVFKKFTVSVNEPDNHLIMRDGVIKVEAICTDKNTSEMFIIGRRYQKIEIMFQAPLLSNQKLYLVADLSPLHTFRIQEIVYKAVKIDNKDGIFIQSLIV